MDMLRVTPEFQQHIARAGLTVAELAAAVEMPRNTLYSWVNERIQQRRKTGIRPASAWKVAAAYAKAEGITKQQAFKLLFEDVPTPAAAEAQP